VTTPDRTAADAFLVAHDAEAIEHPGGTLLAHLRRTADVLERWGAPDELVLAGLCHAAYGTDGFAPHLIEHGERDVLVAIIGTAAEAIVYRYASCDRAHLNAQLPPPLPVPLPEEPGAADTPTHRDRFTGVVAPLSPAELHQFCELTFANELDLLAFPAFFAAHGTAIAAEFSTWETLVSPAAWQAFTALVDA